MEETLSMDKAAAVGFDIDASDVDSLDHFSNDSDADDILEEVDINSLAKKLFMLIDHNTEKNIKEIKEILEIAETLPVDKLFDLLNYRDCKGKTILIISLDYIHITNAILYAARRLSQDRMFQILNAEVWEITALERCFDLGPDLDSLNAILETSKALNENGLYQLLNGTLYTAFQEAGNVGNVDKIHSILQATDRLNDSKFLEFIINELHNCNISSTESIHMLNLLIEKVQNRLGEIGLKLMLTSRDKKGKTILFKAHLRGVRPLLACLNEYGILKEVDDEGRPFLYWVNYEGKSALMNAIDNARDVDVKALLIGLGEVIPAEYDENGNLINPERINTWLGVNPNQGLSARRYTEGGTAA